MGDFALSDLAAGAPPLTGAEVRAHGAYIGGLSYDFGRGGFRKIMEVSNNTALALMESHCDVTGETAPRSGVALYPRAYVVLGTTGGYSTNRWVIKVPTIREKHGTLDLRANPPPDGAVALYHTDSGYELWMWSWPPR